MGVGIYVLMCESAQWKITIETKLQPELVQQLFDWASQYKLGYEMMLK
jgi:hypothetical protein